MNTAGKCGLEYWLLANQELGSDGSMMRLTEYLGTFDECATPFLLVGPTDDRGTTAQCRNSTQTLLNFLIRVVNSGPHSFYHQLTATVRSAMEPWHVYHQLSLSL